MAIEQFAAEILELAAGLGVDLTHPDALQHGLSLAAILLCALAVRRRRGAVPARRTPAVSTADDTSRARRPYQASLAEDAAPEEESISPVSTGEERPEELSVRLKKTRSGFFQKLKSIFGAGPKLDQDMLDELEALLISGDLGVKTTQTLLESVREAMESSDGIDQQTLQTLIKNRIIDILRKDVGDETAIIPRKLEDGPFVVMVVGINGVGKTTTVAKLASRFKESGLNVMMAAADTFRAAAVEQLCLWGKNIDVPVISGPADAKPATVVFDAMIEARKACADVLLIDTAGRLHTKSNLMQELEGVTNSIKRHQQSAPHEVVLVVDGSTGQNAISQAREFNSSVPLTGLVVTKLDGTPKGGVVVAIKDELGIPIRYIGVGESRHDLRPFVAGEFAEALFSGDESDVESEDAGKVSAHAATRRRKRAQEA